MLALFSFSHAEGDGPRDVVEFLVDGEDDGGCAPLDGEGLLVGGGVEGDGEFDVALDVGGDVGEVVSDSAEEVGDCFLSRAAITMGMRY